MWEEKYGTKAKHLRRIVSKRKSAFQETLSNLLFYHHCHVIGRLQGDKKLGETRKVKERDRAVESKVASHPSWVAKRQQKTGIEQFQGQKLVFDSD